MSDKELPVSRAAMLFKLLGDKTRLSIVALLKEDECCVCELVEIFQMSQPAISQHLRKLRDADLVKESRRGQWVFYSLNRDSEFYQMIHQLLDYLPDQAEKIQQLQQQGLRISCRY